MTIQERIKEYMKVNEWSEYRLAKEAELPQSTISHLFKRNNAPTFPTLESICNALNITLSQFFADEGESIVLTKEQKENLLLFGSLTEKQQQIIEGTMRQFNKME